MSGARAAGAVLLGLLLGGVAAAEDEPTPPGAEVVYRTSEEVAARLRALEQAGRRVVEYGRSAGGRPLLALRVGTAEAPVVLVHGGLGARDAAGTAACLHLAERLAAGEDPEAANVAWLLVPAPNPDALDAFLAGKPRAGGTDVDRDLDGRRGEDGPSDLDGDGEVLVMRRPSARGTFAAGDEPPKDGKAMGDPRLLVEKGVDVRRETSYERHDEGLDDDGDGEVNEDPPGLDLTRQMSGWTEEKAPWRGDGPFAGYAPETKALMDLSFETTGLIAWYGFASEGPRILRASESGKVADDDDPLYGKVAEALKAKVGLETQKASDGAQPNPGSDLDWAAGHLWVPAFRVPVWRIPKEEASGRERKDADELDWLLWNDRVLGGKGFQAWTPFDHPTLGKVEIGGWRRFSRWEPPADLLAGAVKGVSAAPLVHARFRPVLEADVEVEAKGAGVHAVVVRVRNRGDGPTDTTSAANRKRAMGVRASFAPAEGAEVLGGPAVADLGVVGAGAASKETTWLVRRAAGAGALGTLRLRHRASAPVEREVRTP
jgi:hypothetical protein